jgi:hypothetical protein
VRAARSPLVLLLLAAAAAGFAESAFEFLAGSDDLAAPVAALSAVIEVDEQSLLCDAGALRWEVDAAGSFLPVDGSLSGSVSALLEASRSSSGRVLTGWLSGSASGSSATGAGPASGALGATLVFNGETAGCSLEPWIAVQGMVEPFFETGLAVKVPLLAGSWVLEPGVSAGPRWNADTGLLVRLAPGLAVTWYPGIPLTIDAEFRWTASLAAAGGWDSEWAGTLSLSGTLGGILLFTGTGSLGRGPDGTAADARAELAIILGSPAGGEVSIPIRFGFTGSDAEGFTVGAAVGLRFAW